MKQFGADDHPHARQMSMDLRCVETMRLVAIHPQRPLSQTINKQSNHSAYSNVTITYIVHLCLLLYSAGTQFS